jgi:hypothetical protein
VFDDDDDDDQGGGVPADTQAPTVTATPGTSQFMGGPLNVTLTASDNRDPSPSIYYTTDATNPTAASPLYTGPISINANTVLKFFAVDNKHNASAIVTEGYTRTSNTIELQWAQSGHGDILAEAFRHWDADGEVEASCARCHTGEGFADFLEDGITDNPAPLPIGHYCFTCHTSPPFTRYDDLANHPELEPVAFPSTETASLWGPSNMCASCHQGRSSTLQVDAAITANPGGPFTFINIHYYAAAASYFGAETRGAYQYAGEEYVGRNVFPSHTADQRDCVGCHMRGAAQDHTFVPQLGDCTTCHTGTSFETLSGSPGANRVAVSTLTDELLAEIDVYATGVLGHPVVYYPASYPYFFFDLDDDDVADASEVNFGNRFDQFDEPLLKAAFNFQVSAKDPAGYIHNGTYLRQVLHDSIADLGGTPSIPAPGRTGFDRDNASKSEQWHLSGHARSLGEPFRHWDEDGEVSASCARCHTSPGFVDYVADGSVDAPVPPGSLVECIACHGSNDLFTDSSTRYDDLVTNTALEPVTFPSGLTATLGTSNICMTCHQGRESGVSVDTNPPNSAVQAPTDYDSFDFINRHYYAAGAILFGADVNAAYEYVGAPPYDGQTAFPVAHVYRTTCVGCHMRDAQDHVFLPEISDCTTCHLGITDFEQLGAAFGALNVDYDGDGLGESFQAELDGATANLLAEIQNYARTGLPFSYSSPVIYVPTSYPYWFKDSDDDGLLSPGEDSYANRYRDFDRRLLRAAFNLHAAQDPGSDIHNHKYVLQTMYDSIDDLDNGALDGSAPGTRP